MRASVSRRSVLATLAGLAAALLSRAARALDAQTREFVDMAFEMKKAAERAGDQSYGAIVACGTDIVGFGPSRVVAKKDWTAHAEREAIRDAQASRGPDLSGCVLYSTSRPCDVCERAAADANIARMYYGPDATDAGAPQSRSTGPTR
jgi:tRNA(Arg) A34 adenosine deaminase TadA